MTEQHAQPGGAAASSGAVRPVEDPADAVWTELATAAQIEAQPTDAAGAPFPLAVKANIAVRGFRRSAACPVFDLAPEPVDAHVVALLRRAGAVVVGTTNMHELALGITSDNAAFGAVRVPAHPGRSAGGSSGGSAAAVASGAVRIALGTDTGGSVSIPAAHCGIAGFRPSTGRWPGDGILGLSTTRDTAGVFARSVAELETVDRWVTGDGRPLPAIPDGGIRIGLPDGLCDELHPATRAAFEAALERLPTGVELVRVHLSGIVDRAAAAEAPLVMWESRRLLGDAAARALRLAPEDAFAHLAAHVAGEDVRAILQAELRAPTAPEAYAAAQSLAFAARASYARLLSASRLEGIVFPTTPAPAPVLGARGSVEHLGRLVPIFELYTRNTVQGTVVGAPMITLPAPVADGEPPVGITLQGRRFEDRRALALARTIETALAA